MFAAAVSCGGPARQLEWRVTFTGGADASEARVLRASIHDGTCTGMVLYMESIRIDGSSMAMLPPALEPGRYSFVVAAVDADCVPYAAGCAEIDLPLADGSVVEVELRPQSGTAFCAAEECTDGECGPGVDAGRMDAGMEECAPGLADCNLDPADLCEVVLGTIEDCGGCGIECRLDHATPDCVASACAITGCAARWSDCDSAPANGCETSVETLTDCGGCGVSCELANAIEECDAGRCGLVSCLPGWDDCDGVESNGCETSIETVDDCGSCGNTCTGISFRCAVTAAGASCVDICPAGATACGNLCVNTTSNAQNCGGCGRACSAPNAAGSCVGSSCRIGACDPLWGDCDGDAVSGCERSLTTASDCGSCGSICASTTGVLSCATGTCQVDLCFDGAADCDGVADNGCEADLTSPSHCTSCDVVCVDPTPLCGLASGGMLQCLATCDAPAPTPCTGRCFDTTNDIDNCGGCGLVCALDAAAAVCVDSECRVAGCNPGFDDCDGEDATGCESRLDRDPENCGECGMACTVPANATATCTAETCGFDCMPGFGDCDGMEGNGCEQSLTDETHCGACGRACTRANAASSCATGTCELGACDPGFGDCDARSDNGCEVDTSGDRTNCGMCGNRCTGGGTMNCCTGVCGSC